MVGYYEQLCFSWNVKNYRILMSSKMEQKLAEFRLSFATEFNKNLGLLIKHWSEVRTTKSFEAVKKFKFEVHSLRGSSGTLNFLFLSEKLGIIEENITPCEEQLNTLDSVIPVIDRHMNVIIEASRDTPNPLLLTPDLLKQRS